MSRTYKHLERNPLAQCVGKCRHKTFTGALIERQRAKDLSLSVYRCPHCRGWHIGHASGAVLKRMYAA